MNKTLFPELIRNYFACHEKTPLAQDADATVIMKQLV